MRGGNYWDSGDWRVHRAASQQFSEKCAVDTRVVARKSGRLEEGEKSKPQRLLIRRLRALFWIRLATFHSGWPQANNYVRSTS